MITIEKIRKYLILKIKINFIDMHDYSACHNHQKTGITHLKIIIVSNDFNHQLLINRHRKIFSILDEMIIQKIYSITLYTYTLIEWECKKKKKINLVKCFKPRNIISKIH